LYLATIIADIMNKVIKGIGTTALSALVLLQLYRPAKNTSSTTSANDIVATYQVPDNVANILHQACYDCHSNNTNYPWYSNFQPVRLWLDDHVHEGKDELNFSEYATFTTKRKLKKLKEIVHELEEGDMPLNSYTWIHKEAVLTPEQKQTVIDWAKGLSLKISMEGGVAE
jgi:exonuclease VII small subunit